MNENNLDYVNMSTGGNNLRFSTDHDSKKTKIEIPPGLAKASPEFQDIPPLAKASEEEEEKAIEENSHKIEENTETFA